MISFKNVSFEYKTEEKCLFNNITFQINKGLWSLEGANGSGKSTLLRLINKKLNKNTDILSSESIIECDGTILNIDDTDTFPLTLSEIDIAKFVIELNGTSFSSIDYIPLYKKKSLLHYSTGERKLVFFKLLNYINFDILLIDEYLVNFDEDNTYDVIEILNSLSKNKIIIISTNDVHLKSLFHNKILLSKNGVELVGNI